MMKDKISIVLYGDITNNTLLSLDRCLDSGMDVVYSGFVDCPANLSHNNLTICYSDRPDNGQDNRNEKIVSAAKGLSHIKTKYAFAIKSTQLIPQNWLNKCISFFVERSDLDKRIFVDRIDSLAPFGVGINMFGKTSELIKFWKCELCSGELYSIPKNTYYAVNYLDFYSSLTMDTRLHWRDYLVEQAPKWQEALKRSENTLSKYFVVLPEMEF